MPHWCLTYLYLSPSPTSTVRAPLIVNSFLHFTRSMLSPMICWRLSRQLASFRFSIYDIDGLLFLLLPSTFPCRAVVIKYVCLLLLECPTYLSLLLCISLRSCLCTDSFSRMLLFVRASMSISFSEYVYRICLFLLFLGSKLLQYWPCQNS